MTQNDNYWNHQVPGPSQRPADTPNAEAWQGTVPAQPAFQPQASYQAQPAAPQPVYSQPSGSGQASAETKKGGHGWIVAIVVIVCAFALLAFGVKSCTDSMSGLANWGGVGSHGLDDLDKDAIAVLDIDGTIQYDGTACSPEGFKELLDQAQDDSHVKALVLRVNSGGGTATAGEEMAEYLRQFEKPVVVSSASINASAAYEISAQADYIFVAKSTEIGAIGTAMQMTDLSGLLEKLGVSMETITSSDSKDSTYGYRPLTDEEREYYQDMVDKINQMFLDNVAEGRHMEMSKVKELATGLAYTGVDAVENGLADAIGTREDAIKKAAELAGVEDYTTTNLEMSTYDLSGLAYLLGENRSSTIDLLKLEQLIEK